MLYVSALFMPHRCRLLSSAAAAVAASGGRQPTAATYGAARTERSKRAQTTYGQTQTTSTAGWWRLRARRL